MDELNDKDVPVSCTPEAIVTVSEHGTVETPLDSGVCMSSDQVQGFSAEGAQSCNGEDIMVEVLGTSVYVGGVCTSEGGERSNNEGCQDASANVSAGEDRAVNSSVEADAIPVNESFVQDAGVSDGEVSKSYGSGNEVEGSLGSSELVEEERAKIAPTEVVAVVKREETVTVEEVAVEDIGRVEDTVEVGGKAKDVEMETCVDGSFVVSSSIVETIVVHARAGEEGAIPSGEGENLKVEVGANTGHEGEKDMGVNSGQELVANAEKISENENAHKVEGLGEALTEPRDMNEVGGSSAEAGAPGETFAGEGENLKVDMGASTGQEAEKDAVVNTDQEPGTSRDKVDEDENAPKVEGLGDAVTEPGDKNEVTGSSIGAPGETLAVESGKGLTVEAMEEDTKMADEVVEAPNDLKTLKDKKVHNSDIEATVVPSSATAGDLCGQMQVQAEKTAVANRDKVGENENAPKVEGLGEAVMEPGDKNRVRSSSIGAPGETLAVESGKGLTVEAMEEDTKMADEVVEAPNDLKTLKDKKVQNPDLEAKVVPSSATAGDLSGQMQVQVEKTAVAPTVCEEDLNAKKPLDEQSNVSSAEEVAVMDNGDPPCSEVSAMETDAIGEQDTSHPGDDQLLKNIHCGTGNLGLVHTQTVGNPLSSEVSAMETDAVGEQDASHPGDDQLLKTREIGCSTENLGRVHTQTVGGPLSSEVSAMETDAVGEQDTNHPGDDQPKKTGEIGGSNENPGHVHAHSMPSCLPNEVVAGADLAEKKSQVVSVPEDIKRVEPEVCTDSNVASDIARVESVTGWKKEVDNQNSNLQQIGLDGGGYEKVLVCDNEVPISADRDQPLESEEYSEKSVLDGAPPLCSDRMPEEKVQELHQGQEVLVEGQHEKEENVDGISKNEHQEHVDEKSSLQPTQFVEAEVTASDGNVLLKPNVDQFSKIDTVQGSIEIDANIACSGDIDQMDSEEVPKPATELSAPSENDEKLNFEDSSAKEVASDITAPEGSAAYETGLEGVTDADKVYLHGEQDYEVATEAPEQTIMNEEKSANLETLLPETSPIDKRPGYELPLENDGMFSVSDLVWGKVKSHPWWPGQIFDFTDASEKAMKYHKNDCLLVAYFGDRTFAWNEVSSLKPFRTYFSQMEKQCNSEKFQNAINCALEEVSRRVQLELSHSCLPEEAYEKIKFQSVENVGIRQESSIRDGSDGCTYIDLLEADKLIEYVKALAKFPSAGSDRLELAIAKAQLLAFNRLKGHFSLPEYLFDEGPMETDAEASLHENNNYSSEVIEPGTSNCENAEYASSGQELLKSQKSLSHKRKHNLKDGGYPKSKERSMSELMGVESPDYDNLTAKRLRGNDHSTDAKVSSSSPPVPKPSFKIGECIRRVASQLTGTPTVKSNNERGDISLQSEDANRGVAVDPMEYSSLDELLSQLQLAAQEPLKEYHFLNIIVNFFSDFRNSIIQGQYSGTEPLSMDKVSGKRKKFLKSTGGFPEAFEFDDMNDTYWTDRVIQNGSEEPLPRRNRKKENQIVLVQPEKRLQENHRRSYSRKQYSNANQPLAVETPVEYVDKNAPAELIMNFSEGRSAPSETNLNKMFRRFGPIKEIETEVDKESGRARVVFKKASDAEVAFNSAGKFKIFGPKLVVSYELNYSPTAPFKACSVPTIHDHHEMQLDLSTHDHEMQLGFSTNGHEMQLDLSGHDMQLDLSADDHEMQLDLSNFEV